MSEWTRKYGTPVPGWHLPASKKKQDELAVTYAKDGYALLRAVYDKASPSWLAELPAVETLRKVLVQNYTLVIHAGGREVVKRREKQPEGDGIPPGRYRIASPYDADARWGAKRDESWLGYKLHVTETCDDAPPCGCAGPGHDGDCGAAAFPNLVTCVATTSAAVTDTEMTGVIDDALAAKGLAPGRHYPDSGYLSAGRLVAEAARHGIALIGPLQADTSAQARAGQGYARADFAADYDAQQVTCPQGKTSSSWSPCSQYGRDAIVAIFARTAGQLRSQWADPASRNYYPINGYDQQLSSGPVGPLLGRYPGDTYDGDTNDPATRDHPWALSTANFAALYYRLAQEVTSTGTVPLDSLSATFFSQIGVDASTTPKDAAASLESYGDQMMQALLYHSDHFELSEQFDAWTGYEKSVSDLSWSYAAFLSALRAKNAI